MEESIRKIRETLFRVWIRCRIYKKGLFVVGIITAVVLISGIWYGHPAEDDFLPTPEADSERSTEAYHFGGTGGDGRNYRNSEKNINGGNSKDSKTITMVYDITSALRPYAWREVIHETPEEQNNSGTNEEQTIQGMVKYNGGGHTGDIDGKSTGGKKKILNESDRSYEADGENVRGKEKHHPKSDNLQGGQSGGTEENLSVQGVIMGPVIQVIVKYQGKTRVMTPGQSWENIQIVSADDTCIVIRKGGVEQCVSVP